MHGNGGFAGESLDDEVGHLARLKAVRHGFVAVFTNAGHDAVSQPGADWGFNNIQKEIDFGFRAVHVTAVAAKQLIADYYGKNVAYSYFDGCSTGGLQGFSEAQRFPDDFDGILAGAPVFNLTDMMWQYWKNHKALLETPLSREKLKLLGATVLKLFDAADGVKDGVIGNPSAINFEPRRDLPKARPGQRGFTDAEIEVLNTIYTPTVIGAARIYPRTVIGGEFPGRSYVGGTYRSAESQSAWEGRAVPDSDGKMEQPSILEAWFRYLAFDADDAELDWRTLNPDRDHARMRQSDRIYNATDPDLGEFNRRGGKMIVYHGWADFGISPLRTVEYFQQVATVLGDDVAKFLQLYMIPGMQHCTGGVNIDRFDLMTPLVNWVESGVAPRGLVGYRIDAGKVTRSRPLCAYPQIARYRGTGSIDEHENFECVDPE
jgi:feruloyl esterase